MPLEDRFEDWLEWEIGSWAKPALLQYLADRGYRALSFVEDANRCQRDIYHPERGFFRAVGRDDRDALLGVLRQIWLVDSLEPARGPEVGPASDR